MDTATHTTQVDRRTGAMQVPRVQREVMQNYKGVMKALARSDRGEDRQLAADLVRHIQGEVSLPELTLTTKSQDSVTVSPVLAQEQYFVPFEIAPGVIIPSGNYTWLTYHLLVQSAKTRAVSGMIHLDCCGYLNEGQRINLDTTLTWRPIDYFNLAGTYSQVKLDLPTGKFTVHIGQLNLNMTFTRNLSWNLVGQYDNVSNEFGMNSRIRWAVQPGNDLFLVFNHNADTERGWHSNVSELSAKLGWTFRF